LIIYREKNVRKEKLKKLPKQNNRERRRKPKK
jgi:hypothetical protein